VWCPGNTLNTAYVTRFLHFRCQANTHRGTCLNFVLALSLHLVFVRTLLGLTISWSLSECNEEWNLYGNDWSEFDPECLAFLSKCFCRDNSGGGKDPHFIMWHGTKFDFHGECDLVFLENLFFRDGLGISIHLRTKLRRQWSYVKTLTVRIGSDTLEVQGGADETYWINGIPYNGTPSATLSGYAVSYAHVHLNQRKFVVHLDDSQKIEITTYKDLVSVNIRGATHADFGKSVGLAGEFGTGRMLARDGVSVLDDPVLYGQ
jgi:hypothetical protein